MTNTICGGESDHNKVTYLDNGPSFFLFLFLFVSFLSFQLAMWVIMNGSDNGGAIVYFP